MATLASEGAAGSADARVASGTRGRAALWVFLVLALLIVIVLRSPETVFLPSLEAEDGTFVFPYYYGHRGLIDLVRFQAGYIPFVLNLIAFLSVRLPTRLIPYGFAWLPLILALTAYVWLFLARFRGLLGSDATRALICFLFVLAPVAQYHIYANTTYSIWNALFLLVLLVLTPRSPVGWVNVAFWAATNVFVWSNPLSLLIGPLVAFRLVRERAGRLLGALTLLNVALYQMVGVEKGNVFADLTWLASLFKIARAVGWTFVAVAGTAFRTAFGAPLYGRVESGFWPPVAVWAVFIVIAAVVAARRAPTLRAVFAVLGYVIFAFTFFSMLGRGPSTIFPLNGAPRYVYLPTLAFLVMFVLLLEHFVVAERPRRRAVVFSAVVVVYIALNAQLGHYFVATGSAARPPAQPPSPYLQSHEGNGRIVRDFFAELARVEKQNGSREGIYLTAEKPSDWPIIIDTRKDAPNH